MRIFKFRAWDIEEKRWLSVKEIKQRLMFNEYYPDGSGLFEIHELDQRIQKISDIGYSISLMQYTGLKDKNGKEIYEGDILESDDKLFRFEVIWSEDWTMFTVKGDSVMALIRWATYCKVIGNIYENPDLMQGVVN